MKTLICSILLICITAANSYGGYCVNAGLGVKSSTSIAQYLRDLADFSSGFAVVGSLGSTEVVNKGKPLEVSAILISENASWENDSRKPTVVITGAIHGNEWATPEVCVGIAEYLLENKDNDQPAVDDKGALINDKAIQGLTAAGVTPVPRLTSISELLKTIQIIIVPVYNPEGYDYSQTSAGKKSYYGAGWRPNRRNLKKTVSEEVCYQKNGAVYIQPPKDVEHCFLADDDDTASGGDLEEETLVLCETVDRKKLYIFEPSLRVASAEMFDAIYDSRNPGRMVCASGDRRVWKEEWSEINDDESVSLDRARNEGYLQDAFGTDMNRNFKYQWDVVTNQKHLFIRTRSPSSRMFRGSTIISEEETGYMEKLIAQRNVVALIDYHAGSTQVLYPYAYSTEIRANKGVLGGQNGSTDADVFHTVSEKIAAILNRHDRGDASIKDFTAAQNYNGTSVGSGVARDCYYETENIAAINIEVHNRRYTYEMSEFPKVVPAICRTNVPGAIWFLFWAAGLSN